MLYWAHAELALYVQPHARTDRMNESCSIKELRLMMLKLLRLAQKSIDSCLTGLVAGRVEFITSVLESPLEALIIDLCRIGLRHVFRDDLPCAA